MIIRFLLGAAALSGLLAAAELGIEARADFSKHVRQWDGFGVNYVETAQTRDYEADPQEYGGFSLLSETDRRKVIELIFGADGLKPGLLKMFLDPWHQREPGGPFDHEKTTKWIRLFAREGLKATRARGGGLDIVTTLYGPPVWATKQGYMRGRDLDPARKQEVAAYIIAWVKFLREKEGLPVNWISLHNEGEDWVRWPSNGDGAGGPNHDYNLYWPPEQVVDFLRFMRPMLDKAGLKMVGLTPGETTNWTRFHEWGYAQAIANDPVALKNLGLITSHGFVGFRPSRWFADWRSSGNEILRAKNPRLKSWVTSQSWSKMDADMVNEMRGNIYATGVNGIIPWACIQRPAKWVGGDPNPGKAFGVSEDGKLSVEAGYYFYKQISRAGQPGMAVAQVSSNDTEITLAAFARAGTRNPDALVLTNVSNTDKTLTLRIAGTPARRFAVYRTGSSDLYKSLSAMTVQDGAIRYSAAARTVTTFFGE